MANTKIEWAKDVWNPVTGCTKVSQGCKNCYAERMFNRLAAMENMPQYFGRKFSEVECHPERLSQPLHWKKPRRIFVNSMSDLFHEDVPFEFIDEVFRIIAVRPQHIFMILTKRPLRMREYFSQSEYCVGIEQIKNIWLGVSVENQKTANERIPLLLQTLAAVRFISAEPLLGNIDLTKINNKDEGLTRFNVLTNNNFLFGHLHWVICGGESGPHARPMHPDWARSLRDQCKEANVPFFFKQWGEWHAVKLHGKSVFNVTNKDEFQFVKVGKKKAGRLLDGVEHNEFPV